MRSFRLGFLLGVFGLVACGDGGTKSAGESCVTSGDCEGDLICSATSVCVEDPGGGGGSLTDCDLGYTVTNEGGKDFGEPCDNNSECRFGACVKPGTGGNITNGQFGFCSRGCDCENAEAAKLTVDEKEVLMCLYPSGFKDFHHVVVRCNEVSDCQAIDSRYTECKMPDTGGVQKVCHAL
ncbi:MAG TPA: hypothetical protein PK095_00250 [Myxococcota bacterium]|nr:hypothetical protein [Myxococcota bacterium]